MYQISSVGSNRTRQWNREWGSRIHLTWGIMESHTHRWHLRKDMKDMKDQSCGSGGTVFQVEGAASAHRSWGGNTPAMLGYSRNTPVAGADWVAVNSRGRNPRAGLYSCLQGLWFSCEMRRPWMALCCVVTTTVKKHHARCWRLWWARMETRRQIRKVMKAFQRKMVV